MAKYFITGGSGFIGSEIIRQLIQQGHKVLALAKSESSQKKVKELGAEVLYGSLEDLDALKKGAETTDGVLHLAFIHDYENHVKASEIDIAAITTIGDALAGTGKPLIGTTGTLSVGHPLGTPPSDENYSDFEEWLKYPLGVRTKGELYLLTYKDKGVRASVIRLSPTVHDGYAAGFAILYLAIALNRKEAIYVGDGSNAWTSVHLIDAAALYVLALEKGIAGHVYHGVAEVGVSIKELADTFSEKYGIPTKSVTKEEAIAEIGFFGGIIALNTTATSDITKKELGWEPKGPGLLEDLKANAYVETLAHYGYTE